MTAEHAGDHLELVTDHVSLGLGEDRADRGGDHLGVAFRDLGQDEALRSAPGRLPLSTCELFDLLNQCSIRWPRGLVAGGWRRALLSPL
nr:MULTISPECIES: hypothetical protein [unclassified Pseudonocardia]